MTPSESFANFLQSINQRTTDLNLYNDMRRSKDEWVQRRKELIHTLTFDNINSYGKFIFEAIYRNVKS